MNKIKGSLSAIKLKYIFIGLVISLVAALPIRVYQLLSFVDSSNGFFNEENFTVYLLYAVVAVFSVLFLICSYLSADVPVSGIQKEKNPVLAVSSFLMVAGLLWDMFDTLRDLLPLNQTNPQVFSSIFQNNLEDEGRLVVVLQLVFAFFAIVYFLSFGVSHITGRGDYANSKLLALAPLGWATVSLISRLTREISFLKVSELLFEIFMFVFLMLFFMSFARLSSNVYTDSCVWSVFGCGIPAVLFASLVTVPRIVVLAAGLEPVTGNEFSFTHLAVLIFVLSYVLATVGVGFKGGLETRRTVSELVLPDENVTVTKKEISLEELSEGEENASGDN